MKIAQLEIKNPVLVAPMAGVTDYPYRKILRKMGAELLYTEMVSAKGLVYGNQNTADLVELDQKEYSGVQIFGAEPAIMSEAAFIIERDYNVDLIDINLGCPAPKIVKNNYGSALMKNPELTAKIITAVNKAVKIPVTVKMRKGWDEKNINAVEIAQISEESGASAVTVHGRTREEFYSGQADWDIIRDVKMKVSIPVIGNGDVFSGNDAVKLKETTNCDAVMLARGVQGNPWLVKKCISKLNDQKEIAGPDFEEKIKMAIEHMHESVKYYGETRAVPLMRKHISWYLKGLPYSSDIKDKINQLKEKELVENLLKDYLFILKNKTNN